MTLIKRKKEALQVGLRVREPGEEQGGQGGAAGRQRGWGTPGAPAACARSVLAQPNCACNLQRGKPERQSLGDCVAKKLPFCESWELLSFAFGNHDVPPSSRVHSRVSNRPRAELPTPLGRGGQRALGSPGAEGFRVCLFALFQMRTTKRSFVPVIHQGRDRGQAWQGRGEALEPHAAHPCTHARAGTAPAATAKVTALRGLQAGAGAGHREPSPGEEIPGGGRWLRVPDHQRVGRPTSDTGRGGHGRDGSQGQDLEVRGGRWWEFCFGFPGTSRLLPCLQTKGRIERQTNKQRRIHLGSTRAIRFTAGRFVSEMFVSVKKCQSLVL